MKKNVFTLTSLLLVFMLFFAIVGCNEPDDNTGGGGVPSTPTIPSSVGDYSDLEPKMAKNPNRAVARAGGTASIGIPDYMIPTGASASINSRAAVTATFAVHDDDADIAQIVSQNGATCQVKGLQLGSARIIVTVGSQSATVIIAVTPSEALYRLPAAQVRQLGSSGTFYKAWWTSNQPDELPSDYASYKADPTYQLAWNWRNKGNYSGTSGQDCGIDILAYYVDPVVPNRRGWVGTTFYHHGWHYDLNGVTDKMTDGVQVTGDVKLELIPEFIYDNGVPYLQVTHKLTNTGNVKLTEQKFGASADVMLFGNDRAPLTYLKYGALMTDEATSYGNITYLPKIKLRLVCQNVQGISDVSTLWLGRYGSERNYVYEDKRDDVKGIDSALNFSYQDINLEPGESKSFVIRFTQVQ